MPTLPGRFRLLSVDKEDADDDDDVPYIYFSVLSMQIYRYSPDIPYSVTCGQRVVSLDDDVGDSSEPAPACDDGDYGLMVSYPGGGHQAPPELSPDDAGVGESLPQLEFPLGVKQRHHRGCS